MPVPRRARGVAAVSVGSAWSCVLESVRGTQQDVGGATARSGNSERQAHGQEPHVTLPMPHATRARWLGKWHVRAAVR